MKLEKYLTVAFCGLFLLFFSLWCIFVPTPEYSDSERRVLASFPEFSPASIGSGEFARDFEEYATDRFPLRDLFRGIKAFDTLFVLQKEESDELFLQKGHISKIEYPLSEEMLDHAASLFGKIREKHFPENRVYVGVIPDKNRYLETLKFDYGALERSMQEKMPYGTFLSIAKNLSLDDYYFTDSHWRQERIASLAVKMGKEMGVEIPTEYRENTLDIPFYGVYKGQLSLPKKPDTIRYLTNDVIDSFTVEGASAVYDFEKAQGKDPYEFFLSGNQPLVKIKNPKNPEGKRLVVFRDSYASSLMPLLAQGYSEVTMVDLRYMNSLLLEKFVSFENADILFLYSTSILNHANSMK